MKNRLEIEVDKHADTEVIREKKLKNPLFTRVRILTSVLILLIAAIGGTLAYLAWSGNQTPNRMTNGEIGVQIVENGTVMSVDTNTVSAGIGNKVVALRSNYAANRRDEVVRCTFLPEIQSHEKDSSGKSLGAAVYAEDWSTIKNDSTAGLDYIETDVVRLYLVSGWSDNWLYKDGMFYYKKVVPVNTTTEALLSGIVLQSGVDASNYGDIKVNVIADAIQSEPADAPAKWGLTVDDSGNVAFSGS